MSAPKPTTEWTANWSKVDAPIQAETIQIEARTVADAPTAPAVCDTDANLCNADACARHSLRQLRPAHRGMKSSTTQRLK